jgi:nitronate monooxygenase
MAQRRLFPKLEYPIVGAPLAGGPSTPALTAAVSNAGGLGFLAAGYLSVDALRAQIDETRALTDAPFGVNLFCIGEAAVDAAAVDAYVTRIRPEAEARGVELGEPRFEDDHFDAKVDLVIEERIPIVSFTFGCPAATVVERLRKHGGSAWVTVTEPGEASEALAADADVLVLQGAEAGGHRGSFADRDGYGELSLATLLHVVRQRTDVSLVAAGGLMTGEAVAAVIAAGAAAVQLGSALMLAPEAGTSQTQRRAYRDGGETALTRVFTGRKARGIVNRFMSDYETYAPSAYPQIHHVTSPLRRAGREQGDADVINLWAGQAYSLAQPKPAGEIIREIGEDARGRVGRNPGR